MQIKKNLGTIWPRSRWTKNETTTGGVHRDNTQPRSHPSLAWLLLAYDGQSSEAGVPPLRTFVHGSLARVCCSLGRPRIKPSRRGSRGEHRAARRVDQPGRAVHLKAIAQSKKARRAPQGELARAAEGPRWAALEVRQPRRPYSCASAHRGARGAARAQSR